MNEAIIILAFVAVFVGVVKALDNGKGKRPYF